MCAPLELKLAPALVPPTLAFTPTPHCDLQHFSGASCLHDPHPSQQHPVVVNATATAITTAIGHTFMAYLTFIYTLLLETISNLTGKILLLSPLLVNRKFHWGCTIK